TFADHCTGEKIKAEQKIMVDGLCRDDEDPDKPDKPDDPKDPDDKPDEPEEDTVQFALVNGLDDIYISYESYLETYKNVVDLSIDAYRKGQTDLSAELLNALFGTYEIDSDSLSADSITLYTMDCVDD